MRNNVHRFVLLLSVLLVTEPVVAQEQQMEGISRPSLLMEGESGASSNVIETSQRLSGVPVLGIEVQGNRRVGTADILANLTSKEGQAYNSALLKSDIKALYKLGFFSDVQVFLEQKDEGVVLRFEVVEKSALNEIRVEGNDEVDEDDILEVVELKTNSPLDVPEIHRSIQAIEDLYAAEGLFLAEVGYRLDGARGENSFDVVFTIQENARIEVRQITFVGNKAISDAEISRYMSTRTKGPLSFMTDSGKFNRELFDRDMTMVQALYWDRGYINVQVGTPRVELSADRRYIFLSVPLVEGPRYKIGRINVREAGSDGQEVALLGGRRLVRSMVRSERGSYFSRTSVMEDVNRITRHYQDRGYAYADVELKTFTNENDRIVDLVLEVNRGPKVYFERIELQGNTKTRDRVIRRQLAIYEGDVFSQTGIDVSNARVTQLGFFEAVEVTHRPGSRSDQVIVTVQVTEKHTGQFQVGMGFSTVDKFIAQARVTEQNFFGHGQTISLQAQLSSIRQLFNFDFWEPHFLDTDWTLAFQLFNTTLAQIDYTKTSTGGQLTLGHPVVHRDLRVYFSYTLQHDKVDTGANSGLLIGGQKTSSSFYDMPLAYLLRGGLTSSVGGRLVLDLRNNRLFPTKGTYNSVGAELASPVIGSEFNFTRYTVNSKVYVPLVWKLVFRFNANLGYVQSNTSSGLPISLRYRGGGIMDVRGFYPWSLGPRLSIPTQMNPNAEPVNRGINIGGNLRVTLNTEIEFPLIEMAGIKGVVFFDAGNTFNTESSWCQAGGGRGINEYTDPCNSNPFYLRTSTGFGFRWFSPMGPLRFEWGFPLKRFPGEDNVMFEFTFGNFF